MSGLNFSLGGKLDPSYKASLNQAVAEANAASMRIQNSLRTRIGGLDKSMKGMDPTSPQFAKSMIDREMLSQNLLMVQNAQFAAAAKARVAEKETATWKEGLMTMRAQSIAAADIASNVGKGAVKVERMARGAGGLNLIIRETLVVFREIGRGNWTRIPGSLSLIAQGFSTLKGISLATLGAWGVAIGGLVASVFIYIHRLKQLAKDLTTTLVSTFAPEHVAKYLGKLEILNQLHKDVAESARQIQEAHDSVGESMQRELDLTKSRIAFERELLEAQKANALAAAKNPAEREAIEKKYSQLILAKKKEERDAEFKALQEESKKLPGEIAKTEAEIKKLTEGGGFMSKEREDQILESRHDLKKKADEYFKQLSPDEKDTRAHSADADRKLASELAQKKRFLSEHPELLTSPAAILKYRFTDSDQARLDAANARMKNNSSAIKSYNDFIDSADDRTRARARVKELEDKVKQDQDRLTKLGPKGGGLIGDLYKKNLQQDKQDLALEKERLRRVDPGRPLNGREVTERERVGFGSPQIALLDVNKSMDRSLKQLVQHANNKGSGTGTFGTTPGGFGD